MNYSKIKKKLCYTNWIEISPQVKQEKPIKHNDG